ncbi:MAG TPA: ATP-dependent helicase, partial [Amycolatopsis sp.]|nr:ATP-dependent helicase [Amycolatopsis sp.]
MVDGRELSIADGLPELLAGADAFWATAARAALRLVAAGRLLPGVTAGGHDAWRAGPLEPAEAAWLRDLAAAMPPDERAPGPLLRAFLDAVADTLPRTPAAAKAA